MLSFNKVILSLLKIKSKNLGQNQENLANYLVKDYIDFQMMKQRY